MPIRKGLKAAVALVRDGQRGPETTPTGAQCLPTPARRTLCFSDLPIDIVETVIAQFQNPAFPEVLSGLSGVRIQHPKSAFRGLIPVSMTCRSLRNLCFPHLFHAVKLRAPRRIPQNILYAIQVLYIWLADVVNDQTLIEEQLRQMPRLYHVYWAGADRYSRLKGFGCLAVAPGLRVLTLNSLWLTAVPKTESIPATLRELHLYHPDAWVGSTTITSGQAIQGHLRCVGRLFTALRKQLECLTLYGEVLPLSFIAAYHWPSLAALSVMGRCPAVDVPWMQVLRCMPRLHSLTLLTYEPTIVCAQTLTAGPLGILAQLRRLSLSFPRPDDGIFSHLPPSLVELALRDSPGYSRSRMGIGVELLSSCAGVIRMLGAISARGLRALELVYVEDARELDMLALVAQACPALSTIELHRHKRRPFVFYDWYKTGASSVPVEPIARALAACTALRTARLDLSFSQAADANPGDVPPAQFWDALDAFLGAQAQIVARLVPRLERVAFLARTRGERMCWAVWAVLPRGPEKLGYEDRDWERL